MLYIVIVTPLCNYNCRYCGGSLHGMPDEISYSNEEILELISKDKEAIVAFYGGEPLLKSEKIKEFLDILPAKRFVLQTNGLLIEKLGIYIHKFDSILLSIDGRKEVTDFYRFEACYEKVMKALSFLKKSEYKGEIIARMAVSYKTDIYEDVIHLLNFFPLVHWQLDVIWSNLWELNEFKKWSISYKKGIKKLLNFWLNEIDKGKLPGIIPFLGIATRILNNGICPPCGAGKEAITITTDGKILACPIAPEFDWNILGDFRKFKKVEIGEPCKSCKYYRICGGRCLFFYKERLWGNDGFNEVCNLTKFLIDQIYENIERIPEIRYPEYNNTTEIIP
ncbi:MAG: TIGR04084 family radical SAM/SPASM domain-containing protein [Thermoplasmatales archaeon]|nr:TIGR04084 family radical SAM/SPASM domain-containing protein [Thermoplasmatales archaeon]